nr:MAG TPA: hypothetical protein [Bacteriophage sp.]
MLTTSQPRQREPSRLKRLLQAMLQRSLHRRLIMILLLTMH